MTSPNASKKSLFVELLDSSTNENFEKPTEVYLPCIDHPRSGSSDISTDQDITAFQRVCLESSQSHEKNQKVSNDMVAPKRPRCASSSLTGFKEYYFLATHCSQEENGSFCYECEGGGELICCDTCVRAFHLLCLLPKYRPLEPREPSVSSAWSCPVCLYFRYHDDLEKRCGILLQLRHPLAVPPPECDLKFRRCKATRRLDNHLTTATSSDWKALTGCLSQGSLPKYRGAYRLDHSDSFRDSHYHHHYLYEDAKKRETISTPQQSNSDLGVSRCTRRNVAAAAAIQDKKDDNSGIPETIPNASLARMNVGPDYQVPHLPIPFLEVQSLGRSYRRCSVSQTYQESSTRVCFSSSSWINKAQRLAKTLPFLSASAENTEAQTNQTNYNTVLSRIGGITQDVYDALERLKKVNMAAEDEFFVDTEEKLIRFCHMLSARWPASCHWPYSSEYAYKILYYFHFDAKLALERFEDASFNFQAVCDPPIRPYFNKWKSKDKRTLFPSTPFPPPKHLVALYGSAPSRTRVQTPCGPRP